VHDAPEVDGNVYLEPPAVAPADGALARLRPGMIVEAEIVGAGEHDLEGVIGEPTA